MGQREIPLEEVARHSTSKSLWIVIHDKVYDITRYIGDHPGGPQILMKFAGRDASKMFDTVPGHDDDLIKKFFGMPPIGVLPAADRVPASSRLNSGGGNTASPSSGAASADTPWERPPMALLTNLHEFETVGKRMLKDSAYAYISSGAFDEMTMRENKLAFDRIWFKPRVLLNVREIDTAGTILGHKVSLPVMIAPTAMAKLATPEGEVAYCRASGQEGVIEVVPTFSSCPLEETAAARLPGQALFFQLYLHRDLNNSRKLVQRAERLGYKAIFLTVDLPHPGKREKDMKFKLEADIDFLREEDAREEEYFKEHHKFPPKPQNEPTGFAQNLGAGIDRCVEWSELAEIKSWTSLPLILKGIQTGKDAILAAKAGVEGIVLSNHGGRALDYARPAIEVLPEVVDALNSVGMRDRLEIYIDGGIRRGSDIFKALALGANGVLIGRPTIYAAAAYGQRGVQRIFQILKEELDFTMMYCGARNLSEISRDVIDTRSLRFRTSPPPTSDIYHGNYDTPLFSKM